MIEQYLGGGLALEQAASSTVAIELGVSPFSDEPAPVPFNLGVGNMVLEIRYGGRGSQDAVPEVPATPTEDAKPGKPAVKLGPVETSEDDDFAARGVWIKNPGRN
jgi:hypothetical protein